MNYVLEKRASVPGWLPFVTPMIAVALMLVTSAIVFAVLGENPLDGLYYFFVEPVVETWAFEEVLVKTIPLALIAAGLALCFRSGVWNIGAEGQFIAGAILGSALPVLLHDWQTPIVLPLMLLMGFAGGLLFGLIPAWLKVRFNTSEILTSLMLVYVMQLFLDWLVRGPWRNPEGFNQPESRYFHDLAIMPVIGADRLHIGLPIAVTICVLLAFYLYMTRGGLGLRLTGTSPHAARFAGYDRNRLTYLVMAVAGGLAGLAGIMEVAGPIGQLRPVISPGYGFTAIIVAFLGRLNPIGALIAAFVLSVTYIGGEGAQITIGVTDKITRVFQGLLLFYVLACDTFIHYRLKRVR